MPLKNSDKKQDPSETFPLFSLPTEMIVEIATHINHLKEISNLSQAYSALHNILLEGDGCKAVRFQFTELNSNKSLSWKEARADFSTKVRRQLQEIKDAKAMLANETVMFPEDHPLFSIDTEDENINIKHFNDRENLLNQVNMAVIEKAITPGAMLLNLDNKGLTRFPINLLLEKDECLEFFKNLKILRLCNNKLSGEIVADFGKLENLMALFFTGNELSGEIPVEFVQLQQLVILHLEQNQFSGEIPIELLQLEKLHTFRLNENQFEEIPSQFVERFGQKAFADQKPRVEEAADQANKKNRV